MSGRLNRGIDLVKVWEIACKDPFYQKYLMKYLQTDVEAIVIWKSKKVPFTFWKIIRLIPPIPDKGNRYNICFDDLYQEVTQEKYKELQQLFDDNFSDGLFSSELFLVEIFGKEIIKGDYISIL